MSDNISRQAALAYPLSWEHYDMEHGDRKFICGVESYREYIEHLPSTDRKGEWIYCENDYGIDGYRCDKCGYHVPWDYSHKSIYFIEEYNFCPKCGSEMACDDYEYERAVEQLEHDIMFEPTYDVEDGSM